MLLQEGSQTNTHILFVGAGAPDKACFWGAPAAFTPLESAGAPGELWASDTGR